MTSPTAPPRPPSLRPRHLRLRRRADRLARATGLPQTRIGEIVRGKRAITTDTALRLLKSLGVDDRFWINLQTDDDLEVERDLHGDELAKVTALVAR
ncbi:MAG TPA: HigA family addiction module antitoxin [Dermatophilaceae bacterium]|nr:HigA family addiction module antitoxin [Dermatophilaceae bacterium]